MTAQCALCILTVPEYRYAYGYFSRNLNGIDHMNVRTKFEVRSLTVPEMIRGTILKLGSPWICPRSLFPKCLMGFCSDGLL